MDYEYSLSRREAQELEHKAHDLFVAGLIDHKVYDSIFKAIDKRLRR